MSSQTSASSLPVAVIGAGFGGLALAIRLQAAGIPTAVHYPKPLHHQPAYATHCPQDSLPQSVLMAQQVLSLPMSADLREVDQDRTVDALVRILDTATGKAPC